MEDRAESEADRTRSVLGRRVSGTRETVAELERTEDFNTYSTKSRQLSDAMIVCDKLIIYLSP